VATAVIVVLGFEWAKWGGVFYAWYRAATEPLGYLIIVAGFLAAQRRKFLLVCICAAVGAACREQCLLLIPYYALLHRRVDSLLGIVPALVIFLTIRAVTPVDNDYHMTSAAAAALRVKFGSPAESLRLLACVLTHGGLTTAVLLLRWRTTRHALRRSPHLLFWIFTNLCLGLVGGTDTDRLMYYCFPAELLLLAMVLADSPLPGPVLAILAVGQVAISETFSSSVRAANVFGNWNLIMWSLWTVFAAVALSSEGLRRDGLPGPPAEVS
jgi:hypothetical protein